MAEHPADRLVRDFQDRITRGTFEGLYELDRASRDRVLECQARACTEAFVELYQIGDDLDLDAFLDRMRMGGSSKIRIERDGDTVLWEEQHAGECVCPLVTRGVVPLAPALCGCASHWLRMLFERRVRGPVRVELLDSVAKGGQSCVFRVTLGDPAPR